MQTWVVSARWASGEETPVGLVEASGEGAARARGQAKAARLPLRDALSGSLHIVVRAAGERSFDSANVDVHGGTDAGATDDVEAGADDGGSQTRPTRMPLRRPAVTR